MVVKRNDVLLKGALEDFFVFFLRMIFPDADEIFDFSKDFDFLEQELAEIAPGIEIKHPKIIDKLVGVYLKSGRQTRVRVHVEVEKKAKKEFGRRMFRYFYRLFDKHAVPIISIAVFLEKSTRNNAASYNYSFQGTSVDFRFNSIYVAELDEQELSQSNNPFAKILLITKLAVQKNIPVSYVFDKKKDIARQLLTMDLPAEKIRRLIDFLKAYLDFDEKEINNKFEQELKVLTNKSETMGITEQILDMAEKRGEEKGVKKGLLATAERMLKHGADISLAHTYTGLSLAELRRIATIIK